MDLVTTNTLVVSEQKRETKKRIRKRRSNKCSLDEEKEAGSILFRAKYQKDNILLIIPYTCLSHECCFIRDDHDSDDDGEIEIHNNNKTNKTKKNKKMLQQKPKQLDCMFNHSLIHTNPIHFSLLQFPAPFQPPGLFAEPWAAGLFAEPWAVLGSNIYVFGPRGKTRNKIYYLKKKIDRNGAVSFLNFKKAGYMIRQQHVDSVVALDGKIYVFCVDDDILAEVFEPYQDCPKGQSRPLSSPPSSSSSQLRSVAFAVAIEKEKKIVLGSEDDIFEYDVVGDSWVYHKLDFSFQFRSPLCRPVAAGSCLYWLDTNMWAYDLNTKLSYEGPVQDCLIQHVLETYDKSYSPSDFQVSLLHLSGDLFYMIWVERYQTETLHCTTIQALRTTTNLEGNHYKLQATAFSCQTFVARDPIDLQGCALMF